MKEAQWTSNTLHALGEWKTERKYWSGILEDEPVFASLPHDVMRSVKESKQRTMIEWTMPLPLDLAGSMLSASKQSEHALFILALSGVMYLMRYYSRKEDVMVGMLPFLSGQGASPSLASTSDATLSLLPLRAAVQDDLSFRDWLMGTRSLVLEAERHERIPLRVMQQLLGGEAGGAKPEWSTVVYLEGLHDESALSAVETDLLVGIRRADHEIELLIGYNGSLFSEALIGQWARHLEQFYRAALASPGDRLQDLELLSGSEQHQLLGLYNTAAQYPYDLTIHEQFERQALAYPEETAVQDRDRSLSYRELNERANQLAWTLRKKGVQADSLVALLLARSAEAIIAMLAVMKAGGAYVPIDPDYPNDRKAYTLSDSGATIALTQGTDLTELAFGGTVIDMNDAASFDETACNLDCVSGPDNLCYIIYTSGTTGRPKGVMIEHRNVIRLLFNDALQFDFGHTDVWTLFHSVCFDFSVWEMYGALLYGGKLIIVPKETAQNPKQFVELVRRERVTVLNQTPTAFYYFMEEEKSSPEEPLSLRYVIFGGEALKPVMLASFQEENPSTRLINMYGITETTVHVTFKEVTSYDIEHNVTNIGKPIPTLSTYIMDERFKLLPAGVIGEMYVGGAGVGRGYLNREELTNERFIPHPYKEGERLYRTGDLAKIMPGGDMEYYGRIDHQVKIRGHRIELGEIEAVLLHHPSVKETVIMAVSDANNQTHICAYCVADKPLSAAELRAYTGERLPAYMVPAYFVQLDHIPLTSNGKADRRKLPDPAAAVLSEKPYTPPANEIEAVLCEQFQMLFETERIGIEDSFFDLGGDSIRALRLISGINQSLNTQLQIKDLYLNPVIRDLAAVLLEERSSAGQHGMKEAEQELEALKRAIVDNAEESGKLPPDWEDLYPMSDIQIGMVYYNRTDPDAALYHDQMPFPLQDASFDLERMKQALAVLTSKHAMLRTVFSLESFHTPMQIVVKDWTPDVQISDMTVGSAEDRQRQIESLLREDRQLGFDLSKPLWRVRIVQLNEEQYSFILICHHAILDGWSVAALVTELTNVYFNLKKDEPGHLTEALTPLKNSYKQFVAEQLYVKRSDEIRSYWSKELDDYRRLQLPSRKLVEPEQSETYEFVLDARTGGMLSRMADDYRISLKHICFAIYMAAMSTLTRERDLLVGIVEHNRPHCEDADRMLGCFLNTIPFRLQLTDSVTSSELLRSIDEKLKQLKHYGRLPLADIVRTTGETAYGRNPLYDTFFNYIDFHIYNEIGAADNGGDQDSTAAGERPVEGYIRNNIQFDFTVVRFGDEFKLSLSYSNRVFSHLDVERLKDRYLLGIRMFAEQADSTFHKESLLTDDDKQLLESLAAGERTELSPFSTLVPLIDANVSDSIAVAEGEQTMTYGELAEQSERLAGALMRRGIMPGDAVAIQFEPSAALIVSILAVWKAGAAYVPIASDLPTDRIAFILEDSGSRILLHGEQVPPASETLDSLAIVSFDQLVQEGRAAMPEPPPESHSDDVAYIIYTSGTTGVPKGVKVKHRGLINYVQWFSRTADITKRDRAALLSSYSFDLGYTALYSALAGGSTLHLVSKSVYSDPVQLLSYLERYGITYVKMTPSLFGTLVHCPQPEAEALLRLRLVVLGGESIHAEDVALFRSRYPSVAFMNHYGPTETTIGCVAGIIPNNEWESFSKRPVLGRPIDNTFVYMLDQGLQPVPAGVIGEICVAGEGVAEGYAGLEELTEDKFVTAPLLGREQRVYRTGDLGRFTGDGSIEFMGRADGQVKIRGYRVEPGDVQSALLRHPAVADAFVAADADDRRRSYLTAYTVPQDGEAPAVAELRAYLSGVLPEYMVPSYFVLLDRMPLTANGKVDRRALPAPNLSDLTKAAYEAPRNPVEIKLAEIWREVLNVSQVGIHDHFYELGGDSIKAIQISSRLYASGMQIDLKDFLGNPTIGQMSGFVTVQHRKIDQGAVEGNVVLTPIQRRFLRQSSDVIHHYNQSIMIRFKQGILAETVRQLFDVLVKHHDALRMSYTFDAGGVTQHNRGTETLLYRLEHWDLSGNEDVNVFIEAAANRLQRSFDLTEGPLVKLGLFHTEQGDHLLIVIHHLIIDGVSWRILLEDLKALYGQWKRNEPMKLTDKTDSYMKWAQSLQAYTESKVFGRKADYWTRLAANPVMPLPIDRPAASNKVKDTSFVSFALPAQQTESLLKRVHQAYRTEMNDLLLAALAAACRAWCGMDRVRIELEGHGREQVLADVNVSRTVGWFTAVYPVELDLGGIGYSEHSQLIRMVKEQLRSVPDKGFDYGVWKYLARQMPLFAPSAEISFNYLGQFDSDMETEWFGYSPYSMGETAHPELERQYRLDITGLIAGGQLELRLYYNRHEYEESTMLRLLAEYESRLADLIEHCKDQTNTVKTPSDFRNSCLSIPELDSILARYEGVERIYPLSPMQSGLVFHALMNPESNAYFEQFSFVIRGELNVERFERSFNELLRRYEVFRTAFIYEGVEIPQQAVLTHRHVELQYEEIHDRLKSELERHAYIEQLKAADRSNGFDLASGKLMRMTVVRVEESAYQIIWSHHHTVMDGWCMGIVTNDLITIYDSLAKGIGHALEPAAPYANYIDWLEKLDKEEGLDFWSRYLEGYSLKASFPRTSKRVADEYELGTYTFQLDESTSRKLENVAKQHHVTLYTIIQTLWGLLLQRYNGTDDAVFGSVVSGRPPAVAGIEKMVGLFINTVPVRINSAGSASFAELLKSVQNDSIASRPHEYYSLAEIQNRSELKHNLIDSLLVFENYPIQAEVEQASGTGSGGLSIHEVDIFEQTNYNLDVTIVPEEQLKLMFNYNAAVYEAWLIELIASQLRQAAEQIVANPHLPLEELELITPEHKAQLMSFSTGAIREMPHGQTAHRLIEQWAAAQPDRTAVLFEDEQLSYAEINKKANQMAHCLRLLDIGRHEPLIAILMDRSPRMLISILAVWKAGGAYVPVDPSYPLSRQLAILTESGLPLVIAEARHAMRLEGQYTGRIFVLDEQEKLIGGAPTDDADLRIDPSGLAYVIYTSGSTGRPKGTMIEHAGMLNHMLAEIEQLNIDADTVLAQNANHCFDISVWQFFAALTVGGTTAIYPNERVLDPISFTERLIRDRVSILEVVPTYLDVMMDHIEQTGIQLSSLRYLMITGETAKPALVKRWFELCPAIPMVNAYGPAEAADDVSQYVMHELPMTDNIPIGGPIQNMNLYIVDDAMRLCPVGVVGEICVSGIGVGRGYLNDPDKTSASFMDDPFAAAAGIRLYRTGDLGRWLSDGTIEFYGRKDYQVKIRGFRIELGEIEAKLTEHELVKEAVVIDTLHPQGHKVLYAYAVAEGEVSTAELNHYLSRHLPDYMVPYMIHFVADMPVTPNGKIDRKALPAPQFEDRLGAVRTAPRNETEARLAQTWADVLGIERIDVEDNFFSLGGDSIKAIQIASRLYAFGLKLELKDLFLYPTIAELSRFVKALSHTASVDQGPVQGEVALSPVQLVFFNNGYSAPHHYNQSMMLFSRTGFEEPALRDVFKALVIHHDALRMVFRQDGGRFERSQYNRGVDEQFGKPQTDDSLFELIVHDLRGRNDLEPAIHTLGTEIQQSLNLAEGPLLKLGLFQTDGGDHLLIAIHHLVVDGVSWRILLEDFTTAMEHRASGEAIRLPDKTMSYKSWSETIHRYADSRAMKRDAAYWATVEEAGDTQLPRDGELQGVRLLTDSQTVHRQLPQAETQQLLTSVHHAYNTEINDLLLTALSLSLAEWTKGPQHRIHLEGHGREELVPEIHVHRTVGWFTSVYPVLLAVKASSNGDADLGYLIRSQKEQLRKIPNKGASYGIYKHIYKAGDAAANESEGTAEILFNYLGQFDQDTVSGRFQPSPLSGGYDVNPDNLSDYALDMSAVIENGSFQVAVTYNRYEFNEATMGAFLDKFCSRLSAIIQHCKAKSGTELTPADVGYDGITIEELDELAGELSDLIIE